MWALFSANYNSLAVVDGDGKLVTRISPSVLPDGTDQLIGIVEPLLD